MIILAVETSCDDTCLAIIEAKGGKNPCFNILSNIVSSQTELHRKWGGVYPTLAKREHQKNLPFVFKKALKKAGNPKIDIIAVTAGPGLEPCLWTGVNFAENLAREKKLGLIPVNHIEAHIFANWLKPIRKNPKTIFPAVCLIVSGGHTQLILMKGSEKYASGNIFSSVKYKILGETRDDAAGECFDKAARILGLGYPGGPTIAKLARQWKLQIRNSESQKNSKLNIKLPRPMIHQKNYDFSFSGLKTAVLYDFKNRSSKTKKAKEYIQTMSAEIQQAIVDVLIHKTIKAAKNFKAKTIILGGGVAANNQLRKQLKEKAEKEIPKTDCLLPDNKYCTDNAVMIALAAYFQRQKMKNKNWKQIQANANLRIDEKL